MDTYITKSGDTWDMIAKEVYGNELYTSFLMENNHNVIDYYVFPDGIELKIIALPEYEEQFFPDWRS